MAEFSQLVRARLGAHPPASTHPDADVLAAFAEHRLSGNEREQALAHLSVCADCREVIALASQEQTVEAIASSHKRGRRWFALWRLVLVGALAVLAVSATVLLRLEKPEPGFIAQRVSPPAAPNSATVAAEPEARTDRTLAKSERRQPRSNGESKTFNGSLARNQTEAADALTTREAPAITGGIAAKEVQNLPIIAQRRPAAEPATAPAPAPPPPRAAQPAQSFDQFAQQNQQTAQQKQQGAASTVEVQAAPAPQQQQSASQFAAGYGSAGGVAGGVVGKADLDAKTAKARRAPETAAQANEVTVQSQAVTLKKTFSNGVPSQWTISADGKLERATENSQRGSPWQPVDVGEPAIFRVANANLNDVWAGGNNGALFHSADAGEHWARIVPQDGEHKLDGNVISISIAGATNQIVRLRTSAGQSWISGDGGKTWKIETH